LYIYLQNQIYFNLHAKQNALISVQTRGIMIHE